MNKRKIVIFLIIALLLIVAYLSMKDVLTPYVSFKKAIESGGYVQVIGEHLKSEKTEQTEKFFKFSVKDKEGTVMKINYKGSKPLNFEQANQVVAIGKYNRTSINFDAEKLLVKCPSKYMKEKKQK